MFYFVVVVVVLLVLLVLRRMILFLSIFKVADIRPSAMPGEVQLLLVGHRRLSIKEIVSLGPPLEVEVDHWNTCVCVCFILSVVYWFPCVCLL